MTTPVKVFYSYAPEDKEWQERLQKALSPFRIEHLHRQTISGSDDRNEKLEIYLKQAQIILVLFSPDFLAPKHFDSTEVKRIRELDSRLEPPGVPQILPIWVRPIVRDEKRIPLLRLQGLPKNGEPIGSSKQEDQDQIFVEVAQGIKEIIDTLIRDSDDDGKENVESEPKRPSVAVWKKPPDKRNSFFTGREGLLKQLHDKLTQQKTTALTQPQAIKGLGGIGKTQVAIEYMYRYQDAYQCKFWVVADSQGALINEYVEIARLLNLPQQALEDQQLTVNAVFTWLEEHTDWLIILDNVDDLTLVQRFVPREAQGRILLTTRATALDTIAEGLEVREMTPEEGVELLLLRAKRTSEQEDRGYAEKIVRELGGLPLALDQAGAYIEATRCSLASYFQLYQADRKRLLTDRRSLSNVHPDSVVTTFSQAFQKVKQDDPLAANMLRLCAYLSPDGIPEQFLAQSLLYLMPEVKPSAPPEPERSSIGRRILARVPFIGGQHGAQRKNRAFEAKSQIALDEASEVLLRFSLIHRDNKIITVHRLVQAVMRDGMEESVQLQWAGHAVSLVDAAFPEVVEFSTWRECEDLLPQVLICASTIQVYKIMIAEASRLLHRAGLYLFQHALYHQAEQLYNQTLSIRRQTVGKRHPTVAQSLHDLAELYERLGKYEEAKKCLREALKLRQEILGEEHPETAASLNMLAQLYENQRDYAEAERLYERVLEINQQQQGGQNLSTAQSFRHLATLYQKQRKYKEAEDLYKQALTITSKQKGEEHPSTADILHDQAELYAYQGKMDEAEQLHLKALRIREKALGPKNPGTATSLHSLGKLYEKSGKADEAEQYYKQARDIQEEVLEPGHPDTMRSIYSLAQLYGTQGKVQEAEQLCKHVLEIQEKEAGLSHPLTMQSLLYLVDLYKEQGRLNDAARICRQRLKRRYQKLRADDSSIGEIQRVLVDIYGKLGETEKIEQLYEEAFNLYLRKLGIEHPLTVQCWKNLLKLYERHNNTEKVTQLSERLFAEHTRQLRGKEPLSVQNFEQSLNNLASLYEKQGMSDKLRQLLEHAVQICYRTLGANDPVTVRCLEKFYECDGNEDTIGEIYVDQVGRSQQELEENGSPAASNLVSSVNDLAGWYERQKEYRKAEQLCEETLRTCYKKCGVDDPATSQSRHKLAQLYEDHQKPEEAERIYREAIEVCKLVLEPEHPQTVESQNDLIEYYWRRGKYEEAKPLIGETESLCRQLMERDPLPQEYILVVAQSLSNAAWLRQRQGKLKDAIELIEKASALCKKELGEDHQKTTAIRKIHADVLRKMGFFDQAAAVEMQATRKDGRTKEENS